VLYWVLRLLANTAAGIANAPIITRTATIENSGIVGEGSRLVGEGVEVRTAGEVVAVEVTSTATVYSEVAAYWADSDVKT
jgi:hypothetical protein